MTRPILFAMVHTKKSADYTPHAVASFFATVKLGIDDRFVVIDNDGNSLDLPYNSDDELRIRNPIPLSFASNFNNIMRRALAHKMDIVFLNNDLIFTPDWLRPLLSGTDAIVSPLSNGQIPAHGYPTQMDLSDLEGRKPIKPDSLGYMAKATPEFWVPFFAVRIPYEVYTVVGPLDERFGKAGAEDVDYCIRAWLAGFRCEFRNHSWILHFSGKSTWRGAETVEETQARDKKYRDEFERKWGAVITRHALDKKGVKMPASMGHKEAIEYMIQIGSSGAKE